ncbi:hypothetical protein MJL79_30790, partial [Salmonella enterica subsp. enterica serovar Montevideo]|nr:hypothetical protein [Salmonella enterica subsp. enterica serovar Montevideo]
TTQASGQGMLERVFKLREHGTTARTEVIAGFTTFLTMVYIVFARTGKPKTTLPLTRRQIMPDSGGQNPSKRGRHTGIISPTRFV